MAAPKESRTDSEPAAFESSKDPALISCSIPLPGAAAEARLDWSRLLDVAGSPDRLRQITAEFQTSLADRLQALRRLAAERDATGCTAIAHAAAGACGSIGATGLAEILHRLETDACAGKMDHASELVASAGAEFQRLKQLFADLPIPQGGTAPPVVARPGPLGRILIIEDDLFVAALYRSRLEAANYEVSIARDGQAGFYRIHEWKPDLVLLDLMLPNISGTEILGKIRAERAFRELPVLVFTNVVIPTMLNQAFAAGATQVFNKSDTSAKQMLDTIHSMLNPVPTVAAGASKPAVAASAKLPAFATSASAPTAGSVQPKTMELEPEPKATVAQARSMPPVAASPSAPTAGIVQAKTMKLEPEPKSTVAPASPRPPPSDTTRRQPRGYNPAQFAGQKVSTAPAADRTGEKTSAEPPPLTPGQIKQQHLWELRREFQGFSRAADAAGQGRSLEQMHHHVHALTGRAGITGQTALSELTAALEVFIRELQRTPADVGKTKARTVAQAIDSLALLIQADQPVKPITGSETAALVVDDDRMCREVVLTALARAGIHGLGVEDSQAALAATKDRPFDLIVLDVNMPGMDGYTLCREIRKKPLHATTPIVFVTGMTDLASRGQSRLSGGDDHIGKPFHLSEMTVKAVIHILSRRLSAAIQ